MKFVYNKRIETKNKENKSAETYHEHMLEVKKFSQ